MKRSFEELSSRLEELRRSHDESGLELEDLDPDPIKQFGVWLEDALQGSAGLPNAMTLATADAEGKPSARIVLLKGVDEEGFTFFTNYRSRKGRDLTQNPHAALVFYWPLQERQVCVRGPVHRLSREESEQYFGTRPRPSQLGAWASPQSEEIEDRAFLEDRAEEYGERFGDDVPLPGSWGGFKLVPEAIEFWKSRSDRLHDRFAYLRTATGWRRTRLAP